MKFKANQTVSVKVDGDLITLQKGEEKELPELYGLNPSLEVVESKPAKKVEPPKAEVKAKPAKKKNLFGLGKK
jgi:hypothetical protein